MSPVMPPPTTTASTVRSPVSGGNAIALPSVVLFVTVDPTDLADGLAQVLRLPARFVLGALAGLRMVGLFIDDWRALELARRARGVADRGRLRRFLGMAFALLIAVGAWLQIQASGGMDTLRSEIPSMGSSTAAAHGRPSCA